MNGLLGHNVHLMLVVPTVLFFNDVVMLIFDLEVRFCNLEISRTNSKIELK